MQSAQTNQAIETFKFQLLSSEHADQCIEKLTESFFQIQLFQALNLTYQQTRLLMVQSVRLGIKSGLSIVAKNELTNELAGCVINYDLVDEKQFDHSKLNPQKFEPLYKVFDIIQHDFIQQKGADKQKGEWVHLWLISVFSNSKRKGLCRKLLDNCSKLFKSKDYKFVIVQLVSPYSRRTFLQSSKYYVPIKYLQYNEYEFQGKKMMPNSTEYAVSGYCDLSKFQF